MYVYSSSVWRRATNEGVVKCALASCWQVEKLPCGKWYLVHHFGLMQTWCKHLVSVEPHRAASNI